MEVIQGRMFRSHAQLSHESGRPSLRYCFSARFASVCAIARDLSVHRFVHQYRSDVRLGWMLSRRLGISISSIVLSGIRRSASLKGYS